MSENVTTTLLDFILNLLRDPGAAEAYASAPEAELAKAGLNASPADVATLAPMVFDTCSPTRTLTMAAEPKWSLHQPVAQQSQVDASKAGGEDRPPAAHSEGDGGHTTSVIHQLQTFQNTFTITETHTEQNVWAHGDAQVLFGNDNVAMGDVKADGSFNGSLNHTAYTATGAGSVAGDHSSADNGQHYAAYGAHSVAGADNTTDNSSNSHNLSGSDNAIGAGAGTASGDNNAVGSHATQVTGNDNTTGEHALNLKGATLAGHDVNQVDGNGNATGQGATVIKDSTLAGHDAIDGNPVTVGDIHTGDIGGVHADTAIVDSGVEHSQVAGGGLTDSSHFLSDNVVAHNDVLSHDLNGNDLHLLPGA